MNADLDTIAPDSDRVKLKKSGTVVNVVPMRARQFFRLLRIISHGTTPRIFDIPWGQLDEDALVGRILGMLFFSVPDAEDETIEFLKSMVEPVGLVRGVRLSKVEQERNAAAWRELNSVLENPELDDVVDVVEVVIRREASDLVALGKRLGQMMNLAERTGALSQESRSSEVSPEPSTSSPPSTDGETEPSKISLSEEYGKLSRS